jgi:hypothetical protein
MRNGINRITAMRVENFFIRSDYRDAKVTINWEKCFQKHGSGGAWGRGSREVLMGGTKNKKFLADQRR